MAPALLTTTSYNTSTIYSSYSSETTTTTHLTYPRTAYQAGLLSPAFSDTSSNGSGSVTPTQATAPAPSASAIMFAQRKLSKKPSNSSLRVSPCLPDISESSPTTPTMKIPLSLRAPGTGRPLSVLSEVSVGSNDSDNSQATIDRYKFRFLTDDVESVIEGSVYDGVDGDEEDLRRAELAFAGVKQKLYTFENNISKARDSIMSPIQNHRVSPTDSPERAQPSGLKTLSRIPSRQNIHSRTVSEGAGSQYSGTHHRKLSNSTMTSSSSENYTDANTQYRTGSSLSNRSRSSSRASSVQVKELEDQMNSLAGRLSQLTERTRRESLRRRSMHNLRTPLNNLFQHPEPAASNPEDLISPTSYHTAEDQCSDFGSEDSRSGTPKPYLPIRKTMSYEELGYDSAFSAPGEETPVLISSPRRTRVRDYRSNSSTGSSNGSCGAITPVLPLHQPPKIEFTRNNSASSIASFETAMEDYEEPTHVTPLTYRPHRRTPSNAAKTSPLRAVIDESTYSNEASSNGESSPHDDGYHSGPSTPQGLEEEDYLPIQCNQEEKSTPITKETLKQVDAPLAVPRQSRAKSATNSIIGAENDELALKLPVEDRDLVENLCDQLGKVCCKLEMARTPSEKAEIRRRMEVAMMVLQGMTTI